MTQSYNQITGSYDFGSIVRALQAQIALGGGSVKEYPYNFEGITKAIQDLTFVQQQNAASDIGPSPSQGDVVIDSNGDPQFNYSRPPEDGELWFDTRQGRLFIAYESQWYQTNGGDGFPIVTQSDTPPAATNLVIGQFWYDNTADILYIFAGKYQETDGSIVTTPTATTVPVWTQLVSSGGLQNTATLPLVNATVSSRFVTIASNSLGFLPTPPVGSLNNQEDANLYFLDALMALDDELEIQEPYINITPPANPKPGQFWFDSSTIEMSIWYSAPGDAWGQWVPVFSPAKIDDNLNTLKTSLTAETVGRRAGDTTLQTNIDTVNTLVETNRSTLQNGIDGLQAQINAIPSVDLSPYITTQQEQADITALQNQVSSISADVGNIYTKYSKIDFVNSTAATLQSDINTRATSAQLTAVQNSIPSITGLATTSYVDTQVAGVDAFLSTGDTMTGAITFDKADISAPALDFSSEYFDGQTAQKYRTNCQMSTAHYATFGTNANLFEYAWAFTDNEDFCWTHGTNGKVASIDKTGIAATNYYIANFGTNTSSGRTLTSTIDVGARLQATQTALESLRTNAATATTLDELKTAIATALANV